MMNKVDELYPDITWVYNKKGELKKENFDACDSLICALAHINIKRNGGEKTPPTIVSSIIHEGKNDTVVEYTTKIWNLTYDKKMIIHKKDEKEETPEDE